MPRRVYCYRQVGSTMDEARRLLADGGDEALPLLVQAEAQTSGRGRLGRPWEAPPGSALLLSLALRPSWLIPERAFSLIWMTAVALCEAVAEQTGLVPALKWPNDLLLPTPDGALAKGSGILLEASGDGRELAWVIIGIGINVSAAPPAPLTRYPATSLSAACGRPVSRLQLLRSLLRHLDSWHARLIAGAEQPLFEAWRSRLYTLGREVTVQRPQGLLTGYAEGVDHSGALLVRDATGELHTVTTGDVGIG